MKDEEARERIKALGERITKLEEKAVVSCMCSKCIRRTPHEHIYISERANGKFCEVSAALRNCVGLHVKPGRRCLSCGTVLMLTHFAEVQLEPPV